MFLITLNGQEKLKSCPAYKVEFEKEVYNMKKDMRNTLRALRLKKAGIVGALAVVSAVGGISLQFGTKLLLIPIVLIILIIWMCGRRIYACPHCKTPVDLRLHLHADMKCNKCGRSIMD